MYGQKANELTLHLMEECCFPAVNQWNLPEDGGAARTIYGPI